MTRQPALVSRERGKQTSHTMLRASAVLQKLNFKRTRRKSAERSSSQLNNLPYMDSETTEETHPAPAETTTIAVPTISGLPQDLIDEILNHLSSGKKSNFKLSLQSCALISKSWLVPCRRHLFRTILFTWRRVGAWLEMFPAPEKSPAYYVKELRFWSPGWRFGAPETFFDYIPWFTNATLISWRGEAELRPFLRILSLGSLSQSVTSLTVEMSTISVLQIRDVIARLHNLDDLKLTGSLVALDDGFRLRELGLPLRGKFRGQLTLLKEHVDGDIVDMLLDIPTGLHFTELHIHGAKQNLYSAVRLSEACGKNLTKLTYALDDYGKSTSSFFRSTRNTSLTLPLGIEDQEIFIRTFDFAKLPNLKEADIKAHLTSAALLWVHEALSTIRPSTSPHLSVLQFDYLSPRGVPQYLIDQFRTDLRLIEGEATRIESEFFGSVKLVLTRFPGLFGVGCLQPHCCWFLTNTPVLTSFRCRTQRSPRLTPPGFFTAISLRYLKGSCEEPCHSGCTESNCKGTFSPPPKHTELFHHGPEQRLIRGGSSKGYGSRVFGSGRWGSGRMRGFVNVFARKGVLGVCVACRVGEAGPSLGMTSRKYSMVNRNT